MKIKSIKIENNYIFDNIFLDFSLNNETINTVIFAGENGCGKTKILEIIFNFPNFGLPNEENSNEKREFIIELNNEEINKLKNTKSDNINGFFKSFVNNEISLKIDYSFVNDWDSIKISPTRSKNIYQDLDSLQCSIVFPMLQHFAKSIYLDTEINFNPENIKSVTAMDLDQAINSSYKTNTDLASKITQLLVDIQTEDNSEIAKEYRNNYKINKVIDENKVDLRIRRFKNAFDYMFPYKKYKEVRNEDGFKKVIFEEFGKEMAIENLSSGEKQIVYRGSFLLQNKNSNQNCFILIDEPEISLHPVWQLKIIEFYKYLFKDTSGKQTSQLFFATHSPFIIDNINRYDDKVVILNKDNHGKIFVMDDPKFYGWTNEKIINNAFKINLKIGKYYIFVEGKTDEKYLCKAIEIFNKTDDTINIQEIGFIDEKGNAVNCGATGLDKMKQVLIGHPKLIPKKVILLYDSDRKKVDEDIGNLFIRSIPFIESNKIKKGIENLLNIPSNLPIEKFYSCRNEEDGYGGEKIFKTLDKEKLCNWICIEINIEEQIKYLENFKVLIEKLKNII